MTTLSSPFTALRIIRIQRRLRPVELARRLGVTRAAIWGAEKYGLHNIDDARRYAAILCCRPEDILEIS